MPDTKNKISPSSIKLFNKIIQLSNLSRRGCSVEEIDNLNEEAISIINKDPSVLKKRCKVSDLFAIQNDEIKEYLKECGECINGVYIKTAVGVPLHWVFLYGLHCDDLEAFMLQSYPEVVSEIYETEGEAQTLLHTIMACIADLQEEGKITTGMLEFLQQLLDVNAAAACVPDHNNNLPIHRAVEASCLDAVKMVHDACPQCISIKGQHGNLPLHVATFMSEPLEVLEELLRRYPEGARVTNGDGLLPLHIMIDEGYPIDDILTYLKQTDYYGILQPFPDDAYVSDEEGDDEDDYLPDTPWHDIYMKLERDMDIVDTDDMNEEVALFCRIFGSTPVGVAYPLILHDGIGRMPESHFWSLSSYDFSRTIQIPYAIRDKEGRTALEAALQRASVESEEDWDEYYEGVVECLWSNAWFASFETEDLDVNLFRRELEKPLLKRVDANGRFLLHIAAEQSLPWFAIKDHVLENPIAVRMPDCGKQSGLLPFMLASVGESTDLSAAYELLRWRPDVLVALKVDQVSESTKRTMRRKRRRRA